MNLRIVSWNVRGLNEQDERLQVRNLIRKWKVDAVYLQETKMEFINRGVICSLWGGQHVDWLYLGSLGASGGVLLMWDNRVVDKVEKAVDRFSVSCKFKNMVDHFVWAFTGVYGPNSDRDRSSANFTLAIHQFLAFISEQILIDLPLVGGSFTWSNSREVASRSRLDRFLVSTDWEEKFPSVCQRHLSRLLLDHFPILLEGRNLHGDKKPFRFENIWLKDEGFLERLSSWWESYYFQGTPSFALANKLKLLKLDLKRWNVEEFGNMGLQYLWKEFNALEVIEDDQVLLAEENNDKDRIRGELEKTTLLEEICWRQKSRALFLREGDRNTKNFHRIANSHTRHNTIDRLMVDGELATDQGIIEWCISHFYRQLYTENEVHRPLLDEVFLEFLRKMPLGWTDLLMRKKYLEWSKISMVIKRQVQMVLQWHFSSLVGAW
ncbi:uncharacterized protein LOC126704907 [Quercus robur]|uniref:uncharacterized protein LOC126704907 n=1 Tax=Quercus robur TaxID=38942 RepID=UPI00216158DF|nr:uncharacterized protein LOC126704907 [Quercus robur]